MSAVQHLEDAVLTKFRELGWEELTPIQQKAYPVILRKKNALLVAPTGSGKTEAVVVPVLTALASEGKKNGIRAVYITPLRALNRDIFRRIIKYAEMSGLKAQVRHGDTPQPQRARMLLEPPDLLITTPETLVILLTSKRSRDLLASAQWAIIDELHELVGNERGTHLSVSLERLEKVSGKPLVRIGLSATVGDLDSAAKFLAGRDRTSAILIDHSIRKYDIECINVGGPLADVADTILNLVQKLGSNNSTLVFTNTRDEAESLGAVLKAKSPHIPVEVHHGSLSRDIREEAEAKLRAGEAGIVVCTSSLELGLDIGNVNLVIQIGSARQATKLIQRVGRSRHRIGEVAKGILIAHREDDELESLALIDRVAEGDLEPLDIHQNAMDVLAHHATGLTIEKGRVPVEEVLDLVSRAYPFRNLNIDDVKQCLELLDRHAVARFDGEVLRKGPRTFEYYYENISMIPAIMQFEVTDITTKKKVGRLDQMFVGEYGEPGRSFVLRGNPWRIVSVDDDKKVIHVEPMFQDLTTIPYWMGELIPIDYGTAVRVGKLRNSILAGTEKRASDKQRNRLEESKKILGAMPDENTVVIERMVGSGSVVVHACFGSKVNQTLATILSTLLSSKLGFLIEAKSDAYRIVLTAQGSIAPKLVNDVLKESFDIEAILSVAVIGTHPLNWKTWYVAKRFGVINKDSQYDKRAARLIQERYAKTPLYREVLRELLLEKYDLKRAMKIIEKFKSGAIRIIEKDVQQFSPLAKPILEYTSGFAALPVNIEKSILDLVEERLQNTRNRLVCMSCGRWESVVKTKELKEPIMCPICRSRLIACTYVGDLDLAKIVNKKKKGKKLTPEEEHHFKRCWKTSSLLQNFGIKAVFALSGFGIGPDTGARVLRKSLSQEDFLKNIYIAEKTYVTTRGFWDN